MLTKNNYPDIIEDTLLIGYNLMIPKGLTILSIDDYNESNQWMFSLPSGDIQR